MQVFLGVVEGVLATNPLSVLAQVFLSFCKSEKQAAELTREDFVSGMLRQFYVPVAEAQCLPTPDDQRALPMWLALRVSERCGWGTAFYVLEGYQGRFNH